MKQNVNLRYGSVCSGIEAASIAWEPLGMRPAWFAEIEPFPSAVLAHRWPHIANLGDMTKLAKKVLAGEIESPDVLVGGTPCQAFSIAGLRGGLDDERGALTLKYVELANAIDDKRSESFLKPTVIVWENVPGVLSSADNAFGCFLAGLAGEDAPFEPGDRPESGKSNAFWRWDGKTGCHAPKWPQCGCIYGPQRKVAWRILDAQYFGVAQRRRRVFVVASARTDLDPATVLFEFEGVRRDIAPSRGEGKEVAGNVGNGIKSGSHWDNPVNPHLTLARSHNTGGTGASNQEIFSQRGSGLVGAYRMVAFGEYADDEAASTVKARDFKDATDLAVFDSANVGVAVRRLTPVECERLQGFPDGHTLIPTEKRKKVSSDELAYLRNHYPDLSEEEAAMLAADGPRYKAIGNSMAVPVMQWIGCRILATVADKQQKTINTITYTRKLRTPDEYERPIFKWVGGKFSELPTVLEHLPHGKRLIEPFVGGGSVFTNAGFRHNLLNDINGDLINFYQTLQREGHSLVTLAYSFFKNYNNADAYLEVREAFNRGKYDQLHHAAAFLYLNRHCFNGVTRYNQNGEFNVGYGKYKAPYFPHAEMEAFLADDVLKNTSFVSGDFAGVIEAAGEGDVIFCDPPYEPLPDTEGFTSYSGNSFRFDEQKRLVSLLVEAHQRGAKVVITNSGAPNIRELYERNGFKVHHMAARRSVSCKASTRVVANDIIAIMK
ncbi:TPA: Dam family site-specific DNA-(adenine-N6)-methyltransferase [Escherichia coli]|uniref:Dam family site-specific DNA-(adenine-N6)-methyltransferase n=1 Tax=Escherichia coli TaxID=562 RepID=UPI00175958B1|nr:Dam family site-specific DNA-(adenine-N6)-methyltransferase [Escherichia coli]MDD0091396.1 Dam family site-specific DNA-(adenine-N6)-methyltransferase [Shigella flexneri]HDW5115878.1 Dam family site-specific DNA-(adenine-N6)-methyltransferase [Salmonella enterica subsp. enterica serovar Typhi]MDS1201398.1 Dam family site-specific DNA-(adenine-N6)-methyltransferase [Escherichia coli]HAG8626899.1 Dam family site-specific DNA-(adenine-N6)-methyltransferase [Escherichia coli]HAG9057636.1 Dam fa